MKFPIIETERLLLSEVVDSDVDAIFEIFSDQSVIEYYDVEAFQELAQAQKLVDLFKSRLESKQGIRWGIREKEKRLLIGTCGFNSWSTPMKNAVIGYEVNSKYWNKGIAKEAVGAILNCAFSGDLPCGPIHRVQADTIPGNDASEHLLLALGFKLEGLRRHAGYWKNRFHDLKCFGLLENEYKRSSVVYQN